MLRPHPVHSLRATSTDAAKEKCTQTSQSWKPLQSPIGDIALRNDFVDEYVLTTQKYRTAEAEAKHRQHRVEWVRSEMSKIAAEQNTVGKSRIKIRRRKSIDDATENAEVDPRAAEYRRTDETEKTRGRKGKLLTDEDAQESRLDGDSDWTGGNPREGRQFNSKRCPGTGSREAGGPDAGQLGGHYRLPTLSASQTHILQDSISGFPC